MDAALKCLSLADLRFGTHSFQIGVALMAAALGYGAESIQKLGQWSSQWHRVYVQSLP
ncbi:hypothetical protein JRQ81_014606, partial [Phrynocephalus forsythii]